MAIYLYCIRKSPLRRPADEAGISPVSIKAVKTTLDVVKTIDEGEAYTVPYKELEAVVSEVNLKKFSSEEIQKKAQEDVNWIKEKAQIHEHVIEQAMIVGGPPANVPARLASRLEAGGCGVSQWRAGKTIPIIPMKFGTIFKTKENLKEILKKNYPKFMKTLEKLRGKQEWGVKVYLNEDIFEKQLEKQLEKSEAVAKKQKEVASLPKGMDFFAKKQIEEIIKKEKNRKLGKIVQQVFVSLQKPAFKTSQGKNLDKALTGREEPMVLNANFLIKEKEVAEFQRRVNELKTNYQNLGLEICQSGPWPPYNFVEIAGGKRSPVKRGEARPDNFVKL